MDVDSPFHVLQKVSSAVRATHLARLHLLFSAALTFLPMRVLVNLPTTALLLVGVISGSERGAQLYGSLV